MRKKEVISGIWKLTIGSFVFVQIIGLIVLVSTFASSQPGVPKIRVFIAYLFFLIFSGFVVAAARMVKRLVEDMYDC